MVRSGWMILLLVCAALLCAEALGVERFPPPEFDSHQVPVTTVPAARGEVFAYLDTAVFVAALGISAYLAIKKRSRRGIFALMLFCLAYFGFYRKGCVCPIGAIGNISFSLFSESYSVPVIVVLFFAVPLVFSLFFGRVFCGAVCPLGAIQDAVLVRPVAVPGWLERGLRVIAYLYLGLAVLMAATGSAFIICRYDPFVGFFRLSGNFNMIVVGICFLIVGLFVGRPYCRFFCPYGVLLGLCSRLSKKHLTITPDECIKCRLCEEACPFGVIDKPTVEWAAEDYAKSKRRIIVLMAVLPVIVVAGCGAGYGVYKTVAGDGRLMTGSVVCGGFVGLVIGLKLIRESIRFRREQYEANKGSCFSCGRCFEYCPVGKTGKRQ